MPRRVFLALAVLLSFLVASAPLPAASSKLHQNAVGHQRHVINPICEIEHGEGARLGRA
jgi:hypothetical protein